MDESGSTAYANFREAIGTPFGPSAWITVTQEGVDSFANAISSRDAVHVNSASAAASRQGGTIAQGFYIAGMIPKLIREMVRPAGFKPGIAYGMDGLRFPSFVRVGQNIRLSGTFESAEASGSGVIARYGVTVEIEGGAKPACVGTMLLRYTEDSANV